MSAIVTAKDLKHYLRNELKDIVRDAVRAELDERDAWDEWHGWQASLDDVPDDKPPAEVSAAGECKVTVGGNRCAVRDVVSAINGDRSLASQVVFKVKQIERERGLTEQQLAQYCGD